MSAAIAWTRARVREPSTWSALANFSLALAFWLSTTWPYWRDFIYLAAAFSLVAALRAER
jgi:hypothetical protein